MKDVPPQQCRKKQVEVNGKSQNLDSLTNPSPVNPVHSNILLSVHLGWADKVLHQPPKLLFVFGWVALAGKHH
jgi:hypothetical protein